MHLDAPSPSTTTAPQVKALAQKILAKKPSPGWEYERSGMKLKACKFHVHERVDGEMVVWSACCVYLSDFAEQQAWLGLGLGLGLG